MSADCEVIQILPERDQKHVRDIGNKTIKKVDLLHFGLEVHYYHAKM